MGRGCSVWARLGAVLCVVAAGAGCDGPARLACLRPGADCTLREAAATAGLCVGTAVKASLLDADPLYAPTVLAEFDAITTENEMKWYFIQGQRGVWNFAPADALAAFARENGLRLRGHTLLWATPGRIPDWVNAAPDADTLRAWLHEHVRTVVERYRDDVDVWDVVNEPLVTNGVTLWDNVFLQLLGPGYIAEVFRLVHELDPTAELFLNEVLLEYTGPRAEAFRALVVELLEAGVPLHGVGFQSHLISEIVEPPPEGFREVVASFAELGLAVEITEMDVAMLGGDAPASLARQREIYHDHVAACLAVPACRAVTLWGFTDRHTWIDGTIVPGLVPLPLDVDYARKPAYDGLRDALVERALAVPPGQRWRCRRPGRGKLHPGRGPADWGWDGRDGPR
jgi:endo-1,4-beta-xylanase